jgi:phosphosulfolactate synthase (CoM biosynthesis protein A)
MPSASRNANRKRRQKRTISLLNRAYREEGLNRFKTARILLAVLAQQGGMVEVTQTTVDEVTKNFTNLGFEVVDIAQADPTLPAKYEVRVITRTEPAQGTVPEVGGGEPPQGGEAPVEDASAALT